MNPEQFLFFLTSLSPFIIIKVFVLTILALYIIFALICFRQVDLMNKVVEAQISPVLRLIALIHLGAAVFVFLLSLFLL